jgi:hypothetical protein
MLQHKIPYSIGTAVISLVWLINGFYCKVLNLVPRHRQIVGEILETQHADTLTTLIGIAEVLMVVWILSGIRKRFCAIFQIIIVGIMNILEFVLVPELLLFGRLNIVLATLFILFISFNEFCFGRPRTVSVTN